MSIKLNHISVHFPSTILTNDELAKDFPDTTAELLFKNTGIKQRYVSAPQEIASDLAVKAAENLFLESNINKEDIDFLIFCSEGFDYIAPASSCIIQNRLGLSKQIGCIDLPYGCSGYLYGLGISNGLLAASMAKNVLFLTADIPTKVIHQKDLELRSIFSDIATANLISAGNYNQHFVFGTDGSGHKNLLIDHSGFRNPLYEDKQLDLELPNGQGKMNSTEIFLFAVRTVPNLVNQTLEKYKYSIDDVDLFVFHQASYFMLDVIRRKIKIPKEKFFCNIEQVGNSVSSSIPVALKEAEQKGILKRGMKVMLAGFGIGYSWGATIIEY
ncbi:MAG: 3-oxoacyl-ACP synthase III family protein [Bacteroidia bacterium]